MTLLAPAAGVDGCPGGWVAAVLLPAGPVLRLVAADDVPTLAAYVGIDIPIGLPDGPVRRAADAAARAMLPGRRGSSVFPVPVRAVLGTSSYDEACAVSRAACGRALSKQTWFIVDKIAEIDAVMTPALQDRVAEVHPEAAFTLMNGGEGLPSKKSREGREVREQLLSEWFVREGWPGDVPVAPRPARTDDALDALACAWSALRWSRGQGTVVGDLAARDARGLRMTIRV